MIYGGGFNFLNVSLNDNEHPVFFNSSGGHLSP